MRTGSNGDKAATRSSAAAVVAQLQPFDLRSSGGGKWLMGLDGNGLLSIIEALV